MTQNRLNTCPHFCFPGSNFVPGEGPVSAILAFVGEAPGKEENEQGRPFVGGAGKVLSQLLHLAGIKRKDVFITNVLRCQPPYNRTPSSEEARKCLPLLQQELQRSNLKMLTALGETATTVLTGKTLEWRGCIVPCVLQGMEQYNVLITFHPAYIMRHRKEFSTVVQDLTKLLHPPRSYTQTYYPNASVEVLEGLLEKWRNSIVAVDIETAGGAGAGLNPFTDEIVGIGFCGEPGVAVSITFGRDADRKWWVVKNFLESSTPKVFQNNLFDRTFLRCKGIQVQNLVWDTQDSMYVLYSDSRKSLDYLRSLYTNVGPYKKAFKTRATGVSHLDTQSLGTYNCLDVDVTLQVSQAQERYFTPKLEQVRQHLLCSNDAALEMRLRGVLVDKTRVAIEFLKLKPLVQSLETEFYTQHAINVASPKQVADLLFKIKKLSPPKSARTASGGISVDEAVLQDLLRVTFVKEVQDLLNQILEYRETSKALNTYVVGLYRLIEADGRVHPDWRPTGTDTGRWSCKEPNMQNVPKRLRYMFVASEGKKLFIADYTQLELFTAALLAEDHALVDAIVKGRDVHEEVRIEMSRTVPATRAQAKSMVFGTIYGMTARSAALSFHLPQVLVEAWQHVAVGRFPKLAKFRTRILKFFQEHGYVESWFGRRKYCETETQALNHPVQSAAADITLQALLRLHEQGFDPILTVHDENVCEVSSGKSLDVFTKIVTNPVPQLSNFFPAKIREAVDWGEKE